MIAKRIPIIFLAGGITVKGAEVLLWRYFQPPVIYRLAVTYDPLAIWIANIMIALMFDRWRVFPEILKPTVFDLLLIVVFGLECLLLGFAAQGAWRWFDRHRAREEKDGHQCPRF